MSIVIGAVILLAGLGLTFGVILAVASKFFHVQIDERIEMINEILPGANCGGCGFPGCMGYADAIIMQNAEPTLCAPGGAGTAEKIASLLGIEVEAGTRNFPIVKCQGTAAVQAFEYDGIPSCRGASLIQGGFLLCTSGCLGLGDCASVCPVDAISMERGIPEIDEEICISCGKCEKECPRQIIELRPSTDFVHVRCGNREKGKAAKTACPSACIACKKCEKECPFDAIHVIDNLAVIDYEKCKNCGKCVKVCPMNVIVNLRKERKAREKKEKEAPVNEA